MGPKTPVPRGWLFQPRQLSSAISREISDPEGVFNAAEAEVLCGDGVESTIGARHIRASPPGASSLAVAKEAAAGEVLGV